MVEHAVRGPEVETDGFTVEQWLAFEDAGDLRVELIDGALVVSPAPGGPHQLVVNNLVGNFLAVLDSVDLTVKATGMGVVSTGMRPYQGLIPDVLITLPWASRALEAVVEASDAVLVIEVLSPSSRPRDRVRKLNLYAQMGVPHYWIVDPTPPITITTLNLVNDVFREVVSVSGDEVLQVDVPFTVSIRPSQLVEG